jgi:PIN domain nuclease of toxin-antitoxin system
VRLLLDTHVWLWMAFEPERLGARARSAIADHANELFLSIASTWEIAVKHAGGKLELPADVATYVRSRLSLSNASLLAISLDHVLALGSLADHHRDPFDRMLMAQALVEGMRLVSADPHILSSPLATIDARQ